MNKPYRILYGSLILLISISSYSQVGINIAKPKASLHILPQSTGGTTAEGLIAPNLTRAQVISKDGQYGTDQKGAIVYVTTIDGTVTKNTTNMSSIGYYYFDGASWQPLSSAPIPTEPWQVQNVTPAKQATSNTEPIYQSANVAIGANSSGGKRLHVEGTTNITGATTLGNSLAVVGPTSIASTGSLTLAGNGAGAGKYLMSDAAGKGTWTVTPTKPWQVQGVTPAKQASSNAEVIYQMGRFSIGAASSGYQSYVLGNSSFVGNVIVNGAYNVGLGVDLPTTKLDVRGNQFTSGVAKIGGVTTLNPSAQIELSDINKAFVPNRINLVALNNPSPITTANIVDGMLVFNLKTDQNAGLSPGYYFWRDNIWNRLQVILPINTARPLNFTEPSIAITVATYETAKYGQDLPFPSITIPETGAYSFTYRLYGSVNVGTASPVRTILYIALMKNTSTSVDAAELDFLVAGTTATFYTYSVTLGGNFTKGDIVSTKMSRNNYNWILYGGPSASATLRTTMIWWKL